LYIGFTAIKAIAVVQFGFAIILASQIESALISGITRGILSSYLKAEELSITITHFLFAIGAKAFELSHPAENKA
jgi:hypothetical protein